MGKRSSKGSSRRPRLMMVGASVGLGGAVITAVLAGMLGGLSHDAPVPPGTPRMCPNLEIDASGHIRDKGVIPCNNPMTQNRRVDLIRDGFKSH